MRRVDLRTAIPRAGRRMAAGSPLLAGDSWDMVRFRASVMEYASPRFACTIIGDLVLGVHAKDNPSDADWHEYVGATRDVLDEHGSVKVLAYSEGGGPNSVQRTKANELFKDRPQHVAVMLNSALTRGIVTALSWFNPKIRAFNLDQLDEACKYLELSPGSTAEVRRMLNRLHSAMDAARRAAG